MIRRWVFNIASAASLLLCVFILAAWSPSYGSFRPGLVLWSFGNGEHVALGVAEGQVDIFIGTRVIHLPARIATDDVCTYHKSKWGVELWHWVRTQVDETHHRPIAGAPTYGHHWNLDVACGWIPLVTAIVPLCWLIDRRLHGSYRERIRRRHGLCPNCAYDLTANTSGVCPECGTPIAGVKTWTADDQSFGLSRMK